LTRYRQVVEDAGKFSIRQTDTLEPGRVGDCDPGVRWYL